MTFCSRYHGQKSHVGKCFQKSEHAEAELQDQDTMTKRSFRMSMIGRSSPKQSVATEISVPTPKPSTDKARNKGTSNILKGATSMRPALIKIKDHMSKHIHPIIFWAHEFLDASTPSPKPHTATAMDVDYGIQLPSNVTAEAQVPQRPVSGEQRWDYSMQKFVQAAIFHAKALG